MLQDKEITDAIIGAAIEVHRELGPGLLESAYQRCLLHELGLRGVHAAAEVPVDINYKGMSVEGGYRVDLLVEQRVVVEIKTVAEVLPVHEAQLLTYMRLSGCQTGLLLNFKTKLLRDGILRRVLRLER